MSNARDSTARGALSCRAPFQTCTRHSLSRAPHLRDACASQTMNTSSTTRQNTLDAFLSRGGAVKPVGATVRAENIENIPPAGVANEIVRDAIEDDIENEDEVAILARWRRVFDGVTASSSSHANDDDVDDSASRLSRDVARAAYAYAVARSNARRRGRSARMESREMNFIGDLRRAQCVHGRGEAAKRLKLAASGVASRSLGEYGECALPHASLARLSSRNNAVNAIEFDTRGAYVTSGTNSGAIDVLEVGTLRETRGELYCPKVKLSTERYIEALKWNRARDTIMTVSDTSNDVIAYRAVSVARALGPRRASTAEAPQSNILQTYVANAYGQSGSGFGLHDLICDPNDPHTIVACSSHGQAFIWDTRIAGDKHRGELSSHLKSPLQSLVMSDDGHTIIAGAGDRSELLIWDMRKQSAKSGSSFGMLGVKTERYDLIAHLSLSKLLQKTALGGMMIPKTGVHWIGNDPADCRRLGFHLANGWSGVVDLLKPCVTHAHCPPAPWLEVRQQNVPVNDVAPDALSVPIRDLRRRRACWIPGGRAFAVGLGVKPGVRVLDFAPSAKSRHWVHGLTMADLDEEPEKRYATGNEPVFIETTTKIFTVAAHPLHHGELIAGGESALSLIGYVAARESAVEEDEEPEDASGDAMDAPDATQVENSVGL